MTTPDKLAAMPNTTAVPTLTETLDLSAQAQDPICIEDVVQDVLKALQQHMDGVIEFRLREALTPILTRATDTLIRETRQAWTLALHDLVKRAVEQNLRERQASAPQSSNSGLTQSVLS
jgi:hypothetical protein